MFVLWWSSSVFISAGVSSKVRYLLGPTPNHPPTPTFLPHAAVIHAFIWRKSVGGVGGGEEANGGRKPPSVLVSAETLKSLQKHWSETSFPLWLLFLQYLLKLRQMCVFQRLWPLNSGWWWTCPSSVQVEALDHSGFSTLTSVCQDCGKCLLMLVFVLHKLNPSKPSMDVLPLRKHVHLCLLSPSLQAGMGAFCP